MEFYCLEDYQGNEVFINLDKLCATSVDNTTKGFVTVHLHGCDLLVKDNDNFDRLLHHIGAL